MSLKTIILENFLIFRKLNKIVNCENNYFEYFLNTYFFWIIWIFALKIMIFVKVQNQEKLKFLNFDNFLCENSNSNKINWIKITIIHQFWCENSYSQFCNFFNLDTNWDFPTVCTFKAFRSLAYRRVLTIFLWPRSCCFSPFSTYF